MPVNVDGDLDAGVPHLLLNISERLSILQEQAGKCVPEIVEADLPETRRLEALVEVAPS